MDQSPKPAAPSVAASAPPEAIADVRWLRAIRGGAMLVALAGVLSIYWPGYPNAFDEGSAFSRWMHRYVPLVAPMVIGWFGVWRMAAAPGRSPGAAVVVRWLVCWTLRGAVTALVFLPFVPIAARRLGVGWDLSMEAMEPTLATLLLIGTLLFYLHLVLLCAHIGAAAQAGNAAALGVVMTLSLAGLLSINGWQISFRQSLPPFYPAIGVGYPAITAFAAGWLVDWNLNWSWRNTSALGVALAAPWAIASLIFFARRIHRTMLGRARS